MNRARIVFLILYVLLIFYVSSRPHLQSPGPSFKMKDKVAHVVEYSLLGVLLYWGIGFSASRSKPITFIFLFAVGVSIAGLDEMFQSTIPGRHTSVGDWLADALGVAVGIGILIATAGSKRTERKFVS